MTEIPSNPDIPTYTYKELKKLDLPGYKEPAEVYDVLSYETDWTPVLSASVFLVDPHSLAKKVLTGVRKSDTHDKVVSTPTMQLPKNYRHLDTLVRLRQPYLIGQEPGMLSRLAPFNHEFATIARYKAAPEYMDYEGTLSTYVDKLNMYKLGLPSTSTAVGRATIGLGSACLSSVHIGFSRVGENRRGESLFEPIAKVSASVYLPPEAAVLLPAENEKYAHLGWTEDSRTFAEDVDNKDTLRLAPIAGSIAVWYCAYGLCLKATRDVASREDLDEHFLLDRVAARMEAQAAKARREVEIRQLIARESESPSPDLQRILADYNEDQNA